MAKSSTSKRVNLTWLEHDVGDKHHSDEHHNPSGHHGGARRLRRARRSHARPAPATRSATTGWTTTSTRCGGRREPRTPGLLGQRGKAPAANAVAEIQLLDDRRLHLGPGTEARRRRTAPAAGATGRACLERGSPMPALAAAHLPPPWDLGPAWSSSGAAAFACGRAASSEVVRFLCIVAVCLTTCLDDMSHSGSPLCTYSWDAHRICV